MKIYISTPYQTLSPSQAEHLALVSMDKAMCFSRERLEVASLKLGTI